MAGEHDPRPFPYVSKSPNPTFSMARLGRRYNFQIWLLALFVCVSFVEPGQAQEVSPTPSPTPAVVLTEDDPFYWPAPGDDLVVDELDAIRRRQFWDFRVAACLLGATAGILFWGRLRF